MSYTQASLLPSSAHFAACEVEQLNCHSVEALEGAAVLRFRTAQQLMNCCEVINNSFLDNDPTRVFLGALHSTNRMLVEWSPN